MNQQTKTCQNCKNRFTIEPDDFDFYKKIKVPAPTFCPECRLQRRLAWRNERSLYKRTCDATGKDIISIYSSDKPFKVNEQKYWWSDAWDAGEYGIDYDFSLPFFEQFKKLQFQVPHLAIYNINSLNSEYTNQAIDNKNCYLGFSLKECENTMYATNADSLRDSVDVFYSFDSELIYESIDTRKSHTSGFLQNCETVVDSFFLYNARNAQNCIGGVNLRNKNLLLFGNKITSEEFQSLRTKLGSEKYVQEFKHRFRDELLKYPRRYAYVIKSINSSGDFLTNCKNTKQCFGSYNLEDCGYSVRIFRCKDLVDMYAVGDSELCYEGIGVEEVYGNKLCYNTLRSQYMEYCDFCRDCSYCFGCVGLRNKQYCVLNKQYSKQEYEKLVPNIIQHMSETPYKDKQGRVYTYGEFFPAGLSPFAYNETVAQEYFPLTKEQALEQGYTWKDPEQRNYQLSITSDQLPDHIKDVDDDILKQVIGCEHKGKCNKQCTTAFKIIPDELQFYKKMNLPLPRLCPNCRHYQRLQQRNPLKLWHRKCQCAGEKSDNNVYKNTAKHFHNTNHCSNEFETTYSAERKEIVYCKKCYQAEVV
ncbi:hypothetical protein MYX07_01505 [Patescibacteria group bacterium AH-259-L07]|nr:hypothetical protein [Patescibacteria group bacterium AH-259-L07]